LNYIITKIVVRLLSWVGFISNSELFMRISVSIFFTTFFNTAVVILLANADLKEAFPVL